MAKKRFKTSREMLDAIRSLDAYAGNERQINVTNTKRGPKVSGSVTSRSTAQTRGGKKRKQRKQK
jgi:hypothetical protein